MSLTVGTPGVVFHQTANWVVVRGLERLGYNVTVVENMPHRDMYPFFTGSNGKPATIDIVTGSDLPYNHLKYLGPKMWTATSPWVPPPNWEATSWSVMGTVNEATDILVSAPAAALVSSVADLKSVGKSFNRTILGLDQNTCPACVTNGKILVDALGHPWKYKPLNSMALVDAVNANLAHNRTKFAVVWFVPTYLNGLLKELVPLEGTAPWPQVTANQGKVIVRNDRTDKLTQKARNFLGACYIGNKHIVQMGLEVYHKGKTPKDAADRWIVQNPHIFDMFLGKFNVKATTSYAV